MTELEAFVTMIYYAKLMAMAIHGLTWAYCSNGLLVLCYVQQTVSGDGLSTMLY